MTFNDDPGSPIVAHALRRLMSFVPPLAAAFFYAAAALIDPLLGLSDGQPPVIQLELGAAFAIVLLFGLRQVLPVMLAELALALLAGQAPLPALGSAGFIGLLISTGTQMLRHFPVQPFPRMRADHYMWFLAVALLLSVIHGARLAWQPGMPFHLSDWTLHAAASFAGTVLIVQLAAGWLERVSAHYIVRDLPATLPWVALTLLTTAAIFLRVLDGPEPFMFLLPAVLVWAAIRLKVRWMSLLLILMHGLAFWGTRQGLGPFGNDTPLGTLVLLQSFIITLSIAPYSLSITLNERAAASRRARTREAQLLDLFDGSIQGILIHRRFQPLFANRRAAELLGFQSVADLMTRGSLADMISAKDLPTVNSDGSRRQLASGRILPMQTEIVRADGQQRTLDAFIRQVMWKGEPAIQATFIDVTDDLRARHEQRSRLERQERQLAAIIRLSTDSALSAGEDSALRTLTEAAAEALSASRASVWRLDERSRQLICLDMFDPGHPAPGRAPVSAIDAGAFPDYFDALRGGHTINATDARTHPATAMLAKRYLEQGAAAAMLDAPVFLDGRLAGVVCLEQHDAEREWAHDESRFAGELASLLSRFLVVRERRAAQAEQARLSAILDATPDCVSTVGTDLRVSYLNLSARRILGLPLDAPPEQLEVKDFHPADTYQHYLDVQLPAVLRDGIWVGESALQAGHGEMVPMSAVRLAHHDASGKVQYISSVLRDISDIKRNEAALRLANETLEQRVAERTAELAQANERLKDLDRLKSMFIASMSHELRTPLNSIIGFTGVVLAGMAGDLTARQQDQLQRVYGSAKHLLALITDVIDISKIEAGFIDVYEERIEVSALIDEAVQSMLPGAREKRLDIAVSVPPGLLVQADRRRLLQCLLNFVSNAVKYTVEGKITVEAGVRDNWLGISVEDTGIGVDEEGLRRLFQPFERIDSRLRVKTPGTGLGLYLTRKIATELLAGSVEVSSTPGVGSRFTLHVPREGSGRASNGTAP
jgi:PAS domain S-box-containing protein